MPSSAALEQQIRSLREIENIVGAMKAYAGVAVRKAEAVVCNIRACEKSARDALADLVARYPHLSPGQSGSGRRIVVAFGSSLGLCGMFNEKMAEAVAAGSGGDALLVIGRRLRYLIEAKGLACAGRFEAPAGVDGIRGALQESLGHIRDLYARPEYYQLAFAFTSVSDNQAQIAIERVLPPDLGETGSADGACGPLLTYEEPQAVFAGVLEEFLSASLYRCYVESLRSENWFRLRTMEGAAESLKKRTAELSSLQNYVRQEEITEEMLEILGGGMFYR
jgi:ATP synthase F1 gamma subunit